MPVIVNTTGAAACLDKGAQGEIHFIPEAALVWENETIKWIGREADLPPEYSAAVKIDAGRKILLPGLVDCHTHLVFGGWRDDEFKMRIEGKTYLEIQKAGGGINATVKKTREADTEILAEKALSLLKEAASLGVTTVEAKSGYGLDPENELKILKIYKTLNKKQPVSIVPTFLGAHVVPQEFKESREKYIELLTKEIIPRVAAEKLAVFCDVFVEQGAFTVLEAEAILECAKSYGLSPKLHTEQLSSSGGIELAEKVGAVSADHLDCITESGLFTLANSSTIAVLLPLASLYTFTPPLNGRRLIESGVKTAVASDFNPGSAPSFHLPFAMTLSCVLNRLTPEEVLKGATIYAARALRREDSIGSLEPGKQADLCLIESENISRWLYNFTTNANALTVKKGEIIYQKSG